MSRTMGDARRSINTAAGKAIVCQGMTGREVRAAVNAHFGSELLPPFMTGAVCNSRINQLVLEKAA